MTKAKDRNEPFEKLLVLLDEVKIAAGEFAAIYQVEKKRKQEECIKLCKILTKIESALSTLLYYGTIKYNTNEFELSLSQAQGIEIRNIGGKWSRLNEHHPSLENVRIIPLIDAIHETVLKRQEELRVLIQTSDKMATSIQEALPVTIAKLATIIGQLKK